MPAETVKKTIHLPVELAARVTAAAQTERRSVNAEIVLTLEKAYRKGAK